jgi:hypothetical protein
MRATFVAALGAAMLLVLAGCSAATQERISASVGNIPGKPSGDNLVAFLDGERGKADGRGLVLIGVQASDCLGGEGSAGVGQMVDGKYKHVATLTANFARSDPHALPAGEYVVGSAGCGNGIRGPHATFMVRAGEFVNVGTLILQSKDVASLLLIGRGSLRRTVGPIDADRLNKLKQEAPALMAKVVQRPMAIAGAEDVGLRMGPKWAM